MDKKKVKELIEQIDFIAHDFIDGDKQEELCNLVSEVQEEQNKSDWVSVEDVLPPYGERVLVRCGNTGLETVEVRHNYLECAFSKLLDGNGFLDSYKVTHWKPIGKLEE